jgi:hypothetical protein
MNKLKIKIQDKMRILRGFKSIYCGLHSDMHTICCSAGGDG